MKLNELVSEPIDDVITDPCRMLPPGGITSTSPYWNGRSHIHYPKLPEPRMVSEVKEVLVVDDETGLITRQVMRDGHLGAVTEDC
jgi:hypothetical protein